METALLSGIALVLGLSVTLLFVCTRLRIPTIVGFLVTGALAGPYGPGLVREVGHVEARLERAHAVVIAIADAAATRRIIEVVRRARPDVYVLARTRFLEEVQALYELGATEVIPEEYETSVEIFARVLRHFLVPPEEIAQQVSNLRADGYEMLRGLYSFGPDVCDLRSLLPNLDLDVTRLEATSPWAGRTLAESDLRRRHGLTVLAVRRGEETIVNPPPDLRLQVGDVLITLRG